MREKGLKTSTPSKRKDEENDDDDWSALKFGM